MTGGTLPTEAQWEYACRAGSETAFALGDVVAAEQVNFDGNYPCPGQPKGIYRETTVPVKALAANRRGLYQMHGNVWEWCADGNRSYAAAGIEAPAVDPQGPTDVGASAHRALRGGSWISGARLCRSASRNAARRGGRHDNFGFRLALSSPA